jgi:hypothetical protein
MEDIGKGRLLKSAFNLNFDNLQLLAQHAARCEAYVSIKAEKRRHDDEIVMKGRVDQYVPLLFDCSCFESVPNLQDLAEITGLGYILA